MDPFLGEIRLFGGTFAPVGWNFCDGTLLDISSNEALYSLIGTAFGGNGQTNFAVPDLRGRVPIHQGQGQGLSPYIIGQTGGVETVTLISSNLPVHSHRLNGQKIDGTTNDPTGNLISKAPDKNNVFVEKPANTAYNPAHVSAATGGSQPHDNMQPYIALNYIIALSGIYPSQS